MSPHNKKETKRYLKDKYVKRDLSFNKHMKYMKAQKNQPFEKMLRSIKRNI